MLVYGKYECFVMQMLYVCVHPGSSLYCILYDLHFVKAGRGCDHMEEPYSRAGLITALQVAMSVSFSLPHPVAMNVLSCVVACVLVLRCCECVRCM